MKNLIFILLFMFLVCSSCSDDTNPISVPPNISKEALEAAPESLRVADQTVLLSTYMWRDFMPISPPDGKPLVAIAFIGTTDSTDISPLIDAEAIYVINGNEVWKAFLHEDNPEAYQQTPLKLVKIAGDGPKWKTQILVDVIVSVVSDGSYYLLKASDQYISETW